MKKIMISIFVISLLFLVNPIQACTTPIVYNEYGVPISLFGVGYLIIDASDYPTDVDTIDYNLKIKNMDDQGLNITFTPSSDLNGYVYKVSAELDANEEKTVPLTVAISGSSRTGDLYVTGQCEDGMPIAEGVIQMKIYGRGDPTRKCKIPASCGIWPDCKNCDDLDGCYNGYHRSYYCGNNQCQYNYERCTSTCCEQFQGPEGVCESGVCTGPARTINLNITDGEVQESAKITLNRPSTEDVIVTETITGLGSLTSGESTVDFKAEYDSSKLIILAQELNLAELTGDTYNIVLDEVTPAISNLDTYRSYIIEFPSDFSFSGIILSIKYSDLSFEDENELSFYKCDDYNTEINTCDGTWSKITTTLDGDYAKAEITSFSVYSLSEPNIQTTTTTTTTQSPQTPTTTGSSGGSSGGGSGGSSEPVKSTGFYDFPDEVRVKAGSSNTAEGNFFNRFISGLSNVQFEITRINADWYSIEPSSVSEIGYKETVDIVITFNIPDDESPGTYNYKLIARSGSLEFEKKMTLVIEQSVKPETTAPVVTTTTIEQETLPEEKEESRMTGLFALISSISGFWYLIPIPIIAFLLVKYFPRDISFGVSNKGSANIENKEPEYDFSDYEPRSKYIEIQAPKEEKPKEKKEDSVKTKHGEEVKRKVIEEIRKSAMKLDKQFK